MAELQHSSAAAIL
ncbi:MAG: hypothetical protein WDW38_010848 [Sanguina aurantia]